MDVYARAHSCVAWRCVAWRVCAVLLFLAYTNSSSSWFLQIGYSNSDTRAEVSGSGSGAEGRADAD